MPDPVPVPCPSQDCPYITPAGLPELTQVAEPPRTPCSSWPWLRVGGLQWYVLGKLRCLELELHNLFQWPWWFWWTGTSYWWLSCRPPTLRPRVRRSSIRGNYNIICFHCELVLINTLVRIWLNFFWQCVTFMISGYLLFNFWGQSRRRTAFSQV